MSIHRRVTTATALVVTALLGLSACGNSAEDQLRPGVAATVGETSISIDRIDARVPDLCRYAVATGEIQEAVPLGSLRISYLQLLVDEELARAYVEEIGRANDPTLLEMLKANEANARAVIEEVPEEAREVFFELVERTGFVGTVQQLGGEEFVEWAKGQDVLLDPRFMGTSIPGSRQAGDLSVAVSDVAVFSDDNEDPEKFQAYMRGLPESQKCSA